MVPEEIANFLETSGIVEGATGWTVRHDRFTESPDRQVAVTQTPGTRPESWTDLERPAFQVRVRSDPRDPQPARAQAYQIMGVLHRKVGDVGGKTYVSILATQSEPFLAEWDENDRAVYAQNFQAMRSRS